MKKSLLTIVSLLAFSFFASAQETPTQMDDKNENAQDKIQQEPPRPEQRVIERNTAVEADKEKQKVLIESKKQKTPQNDAVKTKTKVVQKETVTPKK